MGFPSPAKDYLETALTVNSLCDIDANSIVIKTNCGFAVIDVSLKVGQGTLVLIRSGGSLQFARVRGRAFITTEGEAIEGEALDETEMIGVVTSTIHDMRQDERPV